MNAAILGLMILSAALTPYRQQSADRALRDTRSVIAPTGTLRAVFLASNPVQGRVDPKTGAVSGPAADIVREFAGKLNVPFSIRGLDGVPAVMNAVMQGTADVGFLAFDPTRAEQVGFSQPYSIGHNAYMVRQDSPIRTVAEADRTGIRIGVGAGDAVDLHLSRTLKQAQVVRPTDRTMEQAVRMLAAGEIEAYAANRQRLAETLVVAPTMRLVPGSVLGVQQSIVVLKDNTAAVSALNRFIEELRDSGFLQSAISRANLDGVEVAPK